MITINLSEKQAAELKEAMSIKNIRYGQLERPEVMREVIKQINNQQFDVSDFESSRQYEALSVQSAWFIPKNEFNKGKGWRIKKSPSEYSYLDNWDKATNNVGFGEG